MGLGTFCTFECSVCSCSGLVEHLHECLPYTKQVKYVNMKQHIFARHQAANHVLSRSCPLQVFVFSRQLVPCSASLAAKSLKLGVAFSVTASAVGINRFLLMSVTRFLVLRFP